MRRTTIAGRVVNLKSNELLKIANLSTGFRIKDSFYNAVDGVSLTLKKNEVLAIVGESGCGKSTLATSIMGLYDPHNTRVKGDILFQDKNLAALSDEEMNEIRGGQISIIFQDPLSALNPLMRIGEQIEEGLLYHTKLSKAERKNRALELLEQVGIRQPERIIRQFPHQLSGGMRQRVIIAIAVSCKPKIIIADEPTTALDVTIQAQILDLLIELQAETEAGIILITHDLGVVAEMADRVAVMYAGEIIEEAEVEELFSNPKHPYTRSLFHSIPQLNSNSDRLNVIKGIVPSLVNLPRSGCRFSSRIPWISAEAHEKNPQLHEVAPGHFVRCTCYRNFNLRGKRGGRNYELYTNK
ncbi:ABC transporter ATP-binding protein [Lysinibacillus yapensis]|uniref:ABC transporter ATP-binding protein n=1 Tax=Ureibacillus yapensis TaxID=2304605 RepID=A0A396SE10_9BACL|nr:ABC transporter ATP-binding protein [Lysinibacillus yapensis]RHW39880.1 ABC transporter ATP-binding protein [Lysinibacillus yapensis]